MKLLLLTFAAALSVSAQKATVKFDQAADFGKYHIFAIRGHQLSSKNPVLNSELIAKQIATAIERRLSANGLAIVATGPSALNVRYHLGSARKAELEAYPAGWRGLGTRVVRVPFTEGTLVIDLRDAGTRSLVWCAVAREEKNDATKIESKLDDMVKKSIEKYPPKPR